MNDENNTENNNVMETHIRNTPKQLQMGQATGLRTPNKLDENSLLQINLYVFVYARKVFLRTSYFLNTIFI